MKTTALLLSILMCAAVYPQKAGKSSSRWNSYGQDPSAIPLSDFEFFKKENFYYLLSNDNENFYLDIRVEDSEAETKILRQGLVIWINADGKQQKIVGVRYPIGSQNMAKMNLQIPGTQTQTSSRNPNSPIAQATIVELIGFPQNEQRYIPANNTDNFRGSVHYDDNGALHYRLVMPAGNLKQDNGDKGEDKRNLTLGIEPGAQVMGMRPGGPPAPGGAMPGGGIPGGPAGGGGRRPGGGGGFSGGGGNMPMMQAGPTNAVLWIKDVSLVLNK
ncbi:MAG: hypothetical protein JXN62_08995 [Bacteroidales bacterium]|nr:hypothetical protein [Bacteroidales bacterium]